MDLTFTKEQIVDLEANGISHPMVKVGHYSSDCNVSSYQLPAEYIEKLHEHSKANQTLFPSFIQKLAILLKVMRDPKGIKLTRLDTLHTAILQATLVWAEHRYLFDHTERLPTPWLVLGATYSPANKRNETPANVCVTVSALVRGSKEKRSIFFHHSDVVSGKTVGELLNKEGWLIETPELYDAYAKELAIWKFKFDQHYKQFLYRSDGGGVSYDNERGYRSSRQQMTGEYRVVNDVPTLKLSPSESMVRVPALSRGKDGEGEDADDVFEIPTHLWVYVFNLETHSHMWIEPDLLTDYVYDIDLVNKLIIPEKDKRLLRLLVDEPDTLKADVVKGKSAATIILAVGNPGLGKSMSAESFSEGKCRILYRVQSDQLGVSPQAMETNLKTILDRARRWDAVLLIDEADIYIKARDSDIMQNAIVGTLLRTFEYADGTIFMTTNLGMEVDDAIFSRCSAVIEYHYPGDEAFIKICRIFSNLFSVDASDADMLALRAGYDNKVSGRFVKNLLRSLARRGISKPTLEDIEEAASYLR